MSADVDPEDQTEEPTEKRLHDATERGEVAFSREAPLFASLSATLVALIFVISGRAETLFSALVGIIDDPAGWRIERGEDVLALAEPVVIASARFLLPTVILLIAAGVLASVAQSAPRIVLERIMPDLSRISLRKGLRRLLGARGWTEFLKSMLAGAALLSCPASAQDGRTSESQKSKANADRAAEIEASRFCANVAPSIAEARIAWQTKRLGELDAQVKQRLADLEKAEASVQEWLAKRDALLKAASDDLVAIYAKMQPENAAIQLSAMDDQMAAAILGKLKPGAAGAILDEMEAERASKLASFLSGASGAEKKS